MKGEYKELKNDIKIIKIRLKMIDRKINEIYKSVVKQEGGKLSMADNKGGELSIVNSGILSIKPAPFLPYNKNDVLPKREKDNGVK